MEEHMATKAVTLAQKSGSDAEVLLPYTSADLVGYEKENSMQQMSRKPWTR